MVVLVTGANGQVGQALREASSDRMNMRFIFAGSDALDITDASAVTRYFEIHKPDFCINLAAYTAVDKAEAQPKKAFRINSEGVKILAGACNHSDCTLIQISTDFVFDGSKNSPYLEDDSTNPINVYGASKLAGEVYAAMSEKHYIIRTSWVYSRFASNFYKTMIRLSQERDMISVVDDQIGTPTYAPDLAQAILQIIQSDIKKYGIYHYSNLGQASWFEFAQAIFKKSNIDVRVVPVATSAFPTAAKRPAYSVMDKQQIITVFDLSIRPWQDAIPSVIP